MPNAAMDPTKVVARDISLHIARRSVLLGLCAAPTAAPIAGAASTAPQLQELARLAQPGPFAAGVEHEPLPIDPLPLSLPAGLVPAAWLRAPAAGAGACLPLVVFSGGFLCPSSQYSGLLDHLSSWGFPVASYDYDTRQFLPDPQAAALVSAVAASGLHALARRGRRCAGQDGGSEGAVYYIGHRWAAGAGHLCGTCLYFALVWG